MYFGSVKFFKHLIITTISLMIIIPSGLAVFFGIQNGKNQELVKKYESRAESTGLPKMQYIKEVDDSKIITHASFEYQMAYPDLYVERQEFVKKDSEKPVVYLSFDDGPSHNTTAILDILKENNIKVTFFVTKSNMPDSEELYKRIVAEGHTIGIHTYSHKYTDIYQSVEAYLSDFEKMFTYIHEITGTKPQVFRFPGGSINAYSQGIYKRLISEMLRRGFVYYDWNVASGDAGEVTAATAIENNVLLGAKKYDRSIVLMHDSYSKSTTVAALQNIIDKLKDTHTFAPITPDVPPVVFTYSDD